MELALSLGDSSKPFPFLDHQHRHHNSSSPNTNKDLGFCMGSNLNPIIFGGGGGGGTRSSHDHQLERKGSSDPPLQLDLLPFPSLQRHQQPPPPPPLSQPRFPWLAQNLISESGKRIEMKRPQVSATTTTVVDEVEDGMALSSSPNSAVSSYSNHHQMDFTSMFRKRKRDFLEAGTRGMNSNNDNSSGELLLLENGERCGGDEEDINGLDKKKLRLTKDQSAFLEESFKEHTTLNPKQKLALAKQLNLRPRQVEVWFQNRRARTKLKQTEVDCEYLKRCCETLTEENRRLQKEVQELRALKSSKPFYMQLPATTLTMCPSCERVASTTTSGATNPVTIVTSTATVSAATTNTTLSLASSRSNS